MTDKQTMESGAPDGQESAPKAKVIKRYSNRKLYDTQRSKYVTLEEIARMIKAGDEVTIIDNESKEDLTSVTLTQIIYEEEKRESRMPLGMLRKLIQSGGETLQEFFDKSVITPVSEIRDTAQKSVEKSVEEIRQSANQLRDSATRGFTELTEAVRRVFSREEREAEEFRKAVSVLFDQVEERMKTRTTRVADLAVAKAIHDERLRQEQESPEAARNGSSEIKAQGALLQERIKEHAELVRARLRAIEQQVGELEKASTHVPRPPENSAEGATPESE